MANMEPQKQLLSLIRGFAAEKSHEERRVSDLKKRLFELRMAYDAAGAELDGAKRAKETAEMELKGSQVQLSIMDATIVTQEARISTIRDEISKLRSAVAQLKDEERVRRDEFIGLMLDLNKKIREFQDMTAYTFQKQRSPALSTNMGNGLGNEENKFDMEKSPKALENKLGWINDQIVKMNTEYQQELHDHEKVQQELADMEQRWFLFEAITEETKSLHELARQTRELEKTCASLGEKLRLRYECPACHSNNMGNLDEPS